MEPNKIYKFDINLRREMFYSEENSYGTISFSTSSDNLPNTTYDDFDNKYSGTLVGTMPKLDFGTIYHVEATITNHKKYGKQYKIHTITSEKPTTVEQQAKFLRTLIPESQANQFVKQYPNIIDMIMEGKSKDIDLSKIKGVGNKTFEKIEKKVLENYAIQDILVLLLPLGVTYKMITKLLGYESNPLC